MGSPEKYFDKDGNFLAYDMREDMINEYQLVHVPEIGFYMYNNKIWEKKADDDIRQIIDGRLEERTDDSRVKKVLRMIKDKANLSLNKLNFNKDRLVLLNGTLDLSDWSKPTFYNNKFFKEDYSTIQLNCKYDETAIALEFNKFLRSTFEDKANMIKLIGEMLGYCLTTSTKFEKMFVFYGTGSNGKSVLVNVFEKLLTYNNTASVSMADLDKPFSRSSLKDKLINISTEQESEIMDTGYLKKIVSGDVIDAQFKFKDGFEFRPYCKMIFAMNNLPKTKDTTYGYERRLLIIPFNKVFKKFEQDKMLNSKLAKELDGILQIALQGLIRLHDQNDFTYVEECEKLLEQYLTENNPVEAFINENIVINNNSYVICQDLYNAYREFCNDNGYRPVESGIFGKEIIRKFGDIKKHPRVNGVSKWVYAGISLDENNVISLREDSTSLFA